MDFLNLLLDIDASVADALALIRTIILIAMAVLSALLVVTIFMQPASTQGITALDNSDTYYAKNKKKSTEGLMKMLTAIISITMAVLAVAYFATMIISKSNGFGL